MANNFKVKKSQSIGTSATAIGTYTVPASTETIVTGITLANRTASAITVDLDHYDGATATYIIKDAPIPVGGTLVVGEGQRIVMEVSDQIRVTSDTASSVDATMSILEIT